MVPMDSLLSYYPISMIIKVNAQISFGISLQGRRAKGVFVKAYYRLQQGVRQFVRAHFRQLT